MTTLEALAEVRPADRTGLLRINGIGAAKLERYADDQMTDGVAMFAGQLRERGLTAPLFHDMNCGRWEISPMLCDMGKLSRAVGGWLGSNVYAEDVRDPFYVAAGEYRYSFEEYVHFGHWRPRLMRSYAPDRPVCSPEIASVGDVYLSLPLMGGAEAWCVYMLHQVPDDPPELGAYPSWAMEAPMRVDGEPTDRFWNGKALFAYLGAVPGLPDASMPADVCLTYDREPELSASWAEIDGAGWPDGDAFGDEVRAMNHGRRSQELAQELVRRQIAFDVVDVRYPPNPGWRSRYRHVLEPGDPVPEDDRLRVAWTDVDDVDVTARFGAEGDVYLSLLNRGASRREGTARWREGGEVGFALDGPALSAVHLGSDGRTRSALLGGRASVGDLWFSGRLGAVGRYGDSLHLVASTEGVFRLSVDGRPVWRLLWNGELVPWEAEGDFVQFVDVDGAGRTDSLFVGEPVADYLHRFDRFRELMAERLGGDVMADPEAAWIRAQRQMALARAAGDLDEAEPHERLIRRLRLLARAMPGEED
jgi:hypothetical protein